MTETTDKINQLPDGYSLYRLVNKDGVSVPSPTYLTTDDLKALVSELAAKTKALEHYADELNWGPTNEYWGDGEEITVGHGYDLAREALGERERE